MSKPSAVLAEHWTTLDGVEVFYRESPGPADGSAMVHLHGFGMSGAYLVPTAERLAGEFHTFVPDLPGFGRSGNSVQPLDVTDLAHAAAAFLDDRDIASATLVGNSMGCAVITEFAYLYPDRLDRAVLEALITKFGGGPVGLSTLAIAVGEEPETVETVAEPYLVREGLLGRTPRGRIAMAPAWTHLGYAVPSGVFGQEPLDVFAVDELTADTGAETESQWIPNSH